jgi:hypothetical protein
MLNFPVLKTIATSNLIFSTPFQFAQSDNLPQSHWIVDPQKFFKTVFDESKEIRSIKIVSPNMMLVSFTMDEDNVPTNINTNPIIAAFVTAQARL